MDITEKIYDACIGKDVSECENILKEFGSTKFVDEKIDDGNDDGGYVMMRSYDVGELYVKLYYADSDMVVSYVDVT